ncbi:MAG TPA: ComEC/Rec2 family competence protein [Candidatus Paceibacterota bacterium]|nr:ComEC/Rec2 family competence protein [Candidatus Paceibacterota bacterium]HRZ34276.1 ComEC/Rec2 family competence protein [Candidatus Paceibacterota bacterium]
MISKDSWRRLLAFILFVTLLVFAIFVFSILRHERARKFLTVAFLDVGQGDSIFIETPGGRQVLIDGGPTSSVTRPLSKLLPFYDREIDLIISSHSDLDHIGGFPEIFKRFQVKRYATSDKKDAADLYLELEKLSEKEKADRIFLKSGDRIILDGESNIFLDVLWPEDADSASDNNDASIVVRLVFGSESFILTGDASASVESELISRLIDPDFLRANVLKVGHHGSKTSTSQSFLDLVNPEYAVISVGLDNKFGHPDVETVSLLIDKNIKIFQTIDSGSIIFETDGKSLWVK